MRALRLAMLSSIALAATAAGLVGAADATHGKNKFAGSWKTNIGDVTFDVVTNATGKSRLEALNGKACPAPTIYYLADYSDQSNTSGKMAALHPVGDAPGRPVSQRPEHRVPRGRPRHHLHAAEHLSGVYTADDPQFPGQFVAGFQAALHVAAGIAFVAAIVAVVTVRKYRHQEKETLAEVPA